jgi:low affinity Fe/Cu permease
MDAELIAIVSPSHDGAEPGPSRDWIDRLFTRAAARAARLAGRPAAFLICCLVVVVWAVTGPVFGYSAGWQLVINTGTTIVTFLMVFLIQNEQNRDSAAIQAKLDELIRTSAADNFFVGIEHLTDRELDAIIRVCEARARAERQIA